MKIWIQSWTSGVHRGIVNWSYTYEVSNSGIRENKDEADFLGNRIKIQIQALQLLQYTTKDRRLMYEQNNDNP